MEMAYFALIYAWVDDRINTFRDNFMQNAMSVVASVALSNPTNTYCLPDPNYRAPQQAPRPQPPPAQWEGRWGAVAIDSPKAVMGVAVDTTTSCSYEKSLTKACEDFAISYQFDISRRAESHSLARSSIDAKLKERVAPSQQGQITDAHHAGNALYKQAKSGLEKIDAEFGRKPDQLTDNAAAAIAVAALRGGLTRIDHMTLGGNDNSTIFAIQGKPGAALSKFVDVPTVESMHTPVAQSSQAFAYVQQIQQQQAPQQSNQQAAQHAAPAMAR